jgi:hypothetical protein
VDLLVGNLVGLEMEESLLGGVNRYDKEDEDRANVRMTEGKTCRRLGA